MKVRKVLLFTLVSLLMIVSINARSLKEIQKSGKLIVGTCADYPPFEFYMLGDKEGDIVGIDVEIAKSIADSLKVKVEIKDITFSQLLPTLQKDKIDMVIAGVAPTEIRRKKVDFSDIYYKALQNIVIKKSNANLIKDLGDLRGKKIGVQRGSIQSDFIRQYVSGAYFYEDENIATIIDLLNKGKVDAVILEEPVAKAYTVKEKELMNLKCSDDYKTKGTAIAVKKGNKNLVNKINEVLKSLKDKNKITDFANEAMVLRNK